MEGSPEKDVSTLRGFLNYIDTISAESVKIEIYESFKTDNNQTLKEGCVQRSLSECKVLSESQNPSEADDVKPDWQTDEENKCIICQVQLPSRVSLDRHIVDLHLCTTGRFRCDICHEEFFQVSDLARHKSVHPGLKPFQCSTCKKQFSRQDHLKQHILSHLQYSESEFFAIENGLNRCTVCNKQLSRPQHLRTHMRQHLGTLFECKKCNKRFSRASHLRTHMRLHLGTCFRCDICQKEFSRPSDLGRHKLTHLNKKLFECPTCQKKFSRKDNLKKHMSSHVDSTTSDQDRNNQNCSDPNTPENELCLGLETNLKDDIRTAKPSTLLDVSTRATTILSDIKCYECNICNKCFTRKDHLKRHVKSHKIVPHVQSVELLTLKDAKHERLSDMESDLFESGENCNTCDICKLQEFEFNKNLCPHNLLAKKFARSICEKQFNKKVRLKEPVRLNEESNFISNDNDKAQNKCNICDKQLSRPEHLKAHMRLHLGTLFKCETCDKEFSRPSDLDRHKLVHSGFKQFICLICHKQFSRKDYLKNHMLSHANQTSFECDKCKKQFAHFTNLRNHLHLHAVD